MPRNAAAGASGPDQAGNQQRLHSPTPSDEARSDRRVHHRCALLTPTALPARARNGGRRDRGGWCLDLPDLPLPPGLTPGVRDGSRSMLFAHSREGGNLDQSCGASSLPAQGWAMMTSSPSGRVPQGARPGCQRAGAHGQAAHNAPEDGGHPPAEARPASACMACSCAAFCGRLCPRKRVW